LPVYSKITSFFLKIASHILKF